MRLRFADFEVDEDAFELRRGGERVPIAPLPLRLLIHLLRRHPASPSRDELMETLWADAVVGEASLSRAVRAVRRALGESADESGLIRTVRGHGFGIDAPVEVVDTASEAPLPQEAPVREEPAAPEPASPALHEGFFGRARELAEGLRALDDALAGRFRVLLFAGEPGIGKTRLAEEIGAEARARGAGLTWGRAHEGGAAPPLWPFVQVMRRLVDEHGAPALAGWLGPGGSALAEVWPELKELVPDWVAPPPLDPEAARYRLFEAVTRLLERASSQQPRVVILDDLHWADELSLRLLEFLVREIGPARLLIVVTYRDMELDPHPQLERVLTSIVRSQHASQRTRLGGLAREDVARLVAHEIRESPDEDLVDQLLSRTEGNAFFVQELTQLLRGGERPDAALPAGVQHVIRRRVEALSDETRALLEAAAVIGREFAVPLLARAVDRPPGEVLDDLESAERTRILEPQGEGGASLRFAHALIPETLRDGLASRDRARLHAAVGEALEAIHSDPETVLPELAHHFAAALPRVEVDRALDYAIRATAQESRVLAFEGAIDQARRALRILDDSGGTLEHRRGELLELYAEALFRAGRREEATEVRWQAVEGARRRRDATALARAAAGISLCSVFTAHTREETVGLLREALAALPEGDSALRAELLSWLSRQTTWSEGRYGREVLSREAVEMALRVGAEETLLEVLGTRGTILEYGDDDAAREACYGELLDRARAAGARRFEADGRTLRLQHRIERADPAGIDEDLDELEGLAAELRHPFYAAYAAQLRAARALWRGELEDAEALVLEAHRAGGRVDADHAGLVLSAQLGALRRLEGRSAELLPGVEAALEQYPMMPVFRCALAAFRAESGDLEGAAAALEPLRRDDFEALRQDDPNYWLALALSTETLLRTGVSRGAEALEARLRARSGGVLTTPGIVSAGSADRYLGALALRAGRLDEAAERLDAAVALEERMEARAWLVPALVERARLAEARDEPDPAQVDRKRAREIVTRAGLVGLGPLVEAP